MKITARQYAQTLYDLTDGKSKAEIEKSVADFAGHIYKNRKLKLAGKIIEQFSKIYNSRKGIVEAEVVTAEKISAGAEKKVNDYIEKKYNAKEVVLKNIVDPKIKGGIVLKVGDEVVDGSVRGRLISLKQLLASN
jgi:F-type H+-transporting ATPase subunit delta